MQDMDGRRRALKALGLGLAMVGIGDGGGRASVASEAKGPTLEADGADLRRLTARLAAMPQRRDFKTVPMILDDPAFWDEAVIRAIMAYGLVTKQVWDNTVIEGPWLNLMRNSLNAQVWSFRHSDFLVVSATHGFAHLALYDQAMWDKYSLGKLAGDR